MFSEIKRLFKHTSIYGLGDIVGRSISFILIPLYTHYLSKAEYGVMASSCISKELIEKICDYEIDVKRDVNQRDECCCASSIDIGAYHSCLHDCFYCYANFSREIVEKNYAKHNPRSPLLFGDLTGSETVTERKMKSLRASSDQLRLI